MDDDYDEIYGSATEDKSQPRQPAVAAALPAAPAEEPAPGPPPGKPKRDDGSDEFMVALDQELAQQAEAGADGAIEDDFEVVLDPTDASGPPSGQPGGAAASLGFRYARPGAAAPGTRPEARPYMDTATAASNASVSGAAPRKGPGRGALGGRGIATRPWRPQFVPLGATSIARDDTAAFPESAQPGQLIKLPGQTRVTPEEYSEFTALGQGGVYELDLDRVTDAPWKVPGIDLGDFFNYGLTPAKWRAYAREIQQAHAESRLQECIQLYEPGTGATIDVGMPPELAAALAGKGLTAGAQSAAGPRPPSGGQTQIRHDAADAIIVLAGGIK